MILGCFTCKNHQFHKSIGNFYLLYLAEYNMKTWIYDVISYVQYIQLIQI